MSETARQRFLRNHGENVRLMRARAVYFRRKGDEEMAERIDAIADAWDGIGATAESLERNEDTGELGIG